MAGYITILGAGLAGCEAALRLADNNYKVRLVDCKPARFSPAHTNSGFGELVCSNSLKSNSPDTASGLLKDELRMLNSALIEIADSVKVAAGSALAVDRVLFCEKITHKIKKHPNIDVVCEEVDDWDISEPVIIATGPLTLGGLAAGIRNKLGDVLYFYDAASPIIFEKSLDYSNCFMSSRYNKGTDDYINCPMNREQYELFLSELINAERVQMKEFEDVKVFEGCMPVEIMAERGANALRFGPLRPVGLDNPVTGEKYYAVVQLRRENAAGEMYNMVGFQTNLTFGEQKRVFGLIPALKNAEFARYGVMHRNSFINAPKSINKYFQTLKYPNTFIAGQLSGVEGYVESIASGMLAAINIARFIEKKDAVSFPSETILGALSDYLSRENKNFQPMNANFGLLPSPGKIRDKKQRKLKYHEQSLYALRSFLSSTDI